MFTLNVTILIPGVSFTRPTYCFYCKLFFTWNCIKYLSLDVNQPHIDQSISCLNPFTTDVHYLFSCLTWTTVTKFLYMFHQTGSFVIYLAVFWAFHGLRIHFHMFVPAHYRSYSDLFSLQDVCYSVLHCKYVNNETHMIRNSILCNNINVFTQKYFRI